MTETTIPGYTSRGTRALQAYANAHPENIVWTAIPRPCACGHTHTSTFGWPGKLNCPVTGCFCANWKAS